MLQVAESRLLIYSIKFKKIRRFVQIEISTNLSASNKSWHRCVGCHRQHFENAIFRKKIDYLNEYQSGLNLRFTYFHGNDEWGLEQRYRTKASDNRYDRKPGKI